MKFEKYNIDPRIKTNLAGMGFSRPTDIQFRAIPSILKGEDVLAVAQTGTGKTAAFAIPVIDSILKQKKKNRSKEIRCLVMVPTRELARQNGNVFQALCAKTGVRTLALYGGVEQDPQIAGLSAGVDILVATPGRMFDLIAQGKIRLNRVKILVLDEADRMLDSNFIADIQSIKKKLVQKHQTLFFSATINREIKKLAFSQVRSNAIRIQFSPDDPVSKNVSHFVVFVEMDDKRFFLRRMIHDHPAEKIMVFVRTKVRAERVLKALEREQIQAQVLHGGKVQEERSRVLQRFQTGEIRVLVATDVSARGIDIPDVEYVVNYDLPDKEEMYVHRIGRTGRGKKKGTAVSFCSRQEKDRLEAIQSFIQKPIDRIAVGKNQYQDIIRLTEEPQRLDQLIREIESLEKIQKKKKR